MLVDLPQGQLSVNITGGAGSPVVFLHGFLQDSRVWNPALDQLGATHRCIAPDLPLGAHRRAMRTGADLSFPGLAQLVHDLLVELDVKDATLVANDTGGAVAQIVAARHPTRLARLVLSNCEAFDNFPPQQFTGLVRASGLRAEHLLIAALRIRALRRLPSAFGCLTHRALPHHLIDSWLSAYGADPAVRQDARKVLRGLNDRDLLLATAPELALFTKPTLIIWGQDDKLFPLAHAHRLAAMLPNARLQVLADSRTWVMQDQPAATSDAIGEFIRHYEALEETR